MGCLLEKLQRRKQIRVQQSNLPFIDKNMQMEQKDPKISAVPVQIIAYANEKRILELQKKNCSRNFQIEYIERQKKLKKCEEFEIQNKGKGPYFLKWSVNN